MRYLKLKRCNGIYDFVPLEMTTFTFLQVDDVEYRIELTVGREYVITFEKKYIRDVDEFMKKIASLYDGEIITPEDLS